MRERNMAAEKVLEIFLLWESCVMIPCLPFSLTLNSTQMGSASIVDTRILRGSFSTHTPIPSSASYRSGCKCFFLRKLNNLLFPNRNLLRLFIKRVTKIVC